MWESEKNGPEVWQAKGSKEVAQSQQTLGHVLIWDLVSSGFSVFFSVSFLWQKWPSGRQKEGLR